MLKAGAKLVTLSSNDLRTKSNYQDAGRYIEADLAIAADAEATLPALIEACTRLITPARRRAFDERGKRIAAMTAAQYEQNLAQAASGWDASPISTGRLSAEIWNQIRGEDWSLVSDANFISNWPLRLWDFTRHTVHRLFRRLWHRLRCARSGRRGARQPEAWPADRQHSMRR